MQSIPDDLAGHAPADICFPKRASDLIKDVAFLKEPRKSSAPENKNAKAGSGFGFLFINKNQIPKPKRGRKEGAFKSGRDKKQKSKSAFWAESGFD